MEQPDKPAREKASNAKPIFRSGAAFTKAAEQYFERCDSAGELYSEAGLCLGLQKACAHGRAITPKLLRSWYDDDSSPDLRDAVQAAYLRMQHQIETDSRYWEKSGIASRAAFLLSQRYFGGWPEVEAKQDATVHVVFGDNVDASDFL